MNRHPKWFYRLRRIWLVMVVIGVGIALSGCGYTIGKATDFAKPPQIQTKVVTVSRCPALPTTFSHDDAQLVWKLQQPGADPHLVSVSRTTIGIYQACQAQTPQITTPFSPAIPLGEVR